MFDADMFETSSQAAGAAAAGPRVVALARSPTHSFGKAPCERLRLITGLGVEGDAHCGISDQHLGLGKPDPPPNLRQLHLFSGELIDDLAARGFAVAPGAMGENVVTLGLDLIALPLATRLVFPSGAAVVLTGARTPCRLLDRLGKGLMAALRGDGPWGSNPIAGVMAVVAEGGMIEIGDRIGVQPPAGAHRRLPAL